MSPDEIKRKAEIKQKVEDINRIALDYHLSHAVFACNQLLRDAYKTEFENPFRELKGDLQKVLLEKDEQKQKALLLDKEAAYRTNIKYYIYVEYVNMTASASRVIKTENQLVISLSKELLDQSRENGLPVKQSMKHLRHTTAHELGHAILHSKDIKPGTQGSKGLDNVAEAEADLFAEELLRLRRTAFQQVFKSDVY
jgi:hypothetical protein